MKRTIIFLTGFALVIFGLMGLTGDAQTNHKAYDQNIIKARIFRTPCSGYTVTYTRIQGGYQSQSGPTHSSCTTGTLDPPPYSRSGSGCSC